MAGMRNTKVKELVTKHPFLTILLDTRKWKDSFDAMDTSNDGTVNLVEFEAFCSVLSESDEKERLKVANKKAKEANKPVDMKELLQDELQRICDEKVSSAFKKRDTLLFDLFEGMAALQVSAGIEVTPELAKGLENGAAPRYPARLTNTANSRNLRKTRAEIMNEPYLPVVRKSSKWAVNFLPQSFMPAHLILKIDEDLRHGPGTSNIYEGKIPEKNLLKDANETQRTRHLFVIKCSLEIFCDLTLAP